MKEDGLIQEYKVKVFRNRTDWFNEKDELHRINGAAREWACGLKEWFKNNVHHRLDGPAIEWEGFEKRWFIEGEELSEEEFNTRLYQILEGFKPTFNGSLNLPSGITSIPKGFKPTFSGNLNLSSLTSIPKGLKPTVD